MDKTLNTFKVRHPKVDKDGNIKLNKNGELITFTEDYHFKIVGELSIITPKFLEVKLDTYKEYLENSGLEATMHSFTAHVGVVSEASLSELLYGLNPAHPCQVDIIVKSKLNKLLALIEDSILKDEGQTRAVFRFKSSMRQMEEYDKRKLALEEKLTDRNLTLQEEKFKYAKELAEQEQDGEKTNIILKYEI